MSSYFDRASRMASEALQNGDEQRAVKIVETVVNTYGAYMAFVGKRVSSESRPAFQVLSEHWLAMISRPLIDDKDRAMKMSMLVERIHGFAHALGNARIRRRNGRMFLDNPYEAVKTDMVME